MLKKIIFKLYYTKRAWVAQWIEQKFPKLLVGGSIPLPGTIFYTQKRHFFPKLPH